MSLLFLQNLVSKNDSLDNAYRIATASAAVVIGSVLLWAAFKRLTKKPNPKPTSDFSKCCVMIGAPGGFDQLVPTHVPYASVGANIPTLTPGILDKAPNFKEISKNMILVETHSIGINYADCCVRWGVYSSSKKLVGWPISPGFEFAGRVLNNNGDPRFKKGDSVFGFSLFFSYSTHILVPSEQLFHKPSKLSMTEAGGFLCTAITAYYALFELAAPLSLPYLRQYSADRTAKFFANETNFSIAKPPPMSVLIHSASGGVGSMLVQLCKNVAGFETVVGVVGGQHKVALAKQMGCDITIDYKSSDIWSQIDAKNLKFDIIFDANGVSTLKNSYNYLKPTGKVVVYGFHTMLPNSGDISPLQWLRMGVSLLKTPSFDPMDMVSSNKSAMGFNLSFLFSRIDKLQSSIGDLIEWIESDLVKVAKVTTFPLEDVGKAHESLQSGKTTGKLVLTTAAFQSE